MSTKRTANPSPMCVLVVEDEPEISDLIGFHLQRAGYEAIACPSGKRACELAREQPPRAMLLDLMLPDLSGLEVCRRLRADLRTRELPILMLTARGTEADVLAGLGAGADDYVTKPFSPVVLLARLKALLRRSGEDAPSSPSRLRLEGGTLEIDAERHTVSIDGAAVELTLTEFTLLQALISRPGIVRTRDQIISALRGPNTVLSGRTVDVHVTALRRKLRGLGTAIETVRGVGYRFNDVGS